MSGVRRVYFQDCDAMSYTANSNFHFFIGDKAFADCENLEEVNLMQWTTSGDNHWQALPPTAVKRILSSMLNNSPKAWLRVGNSVYQQYLGSQTWVQVRNRITTFEHASDDIKVDGTVYSFLKAEDGTALPLVLLMFSSSGAVTDATAPATVPMSWHGAIPMPDRA